MSKYNKRGLSNVKLEHQSGFLITFARNFLDAQVQVINAGRTERTRKRLEKQRNKRKAKSATKAKAARH